MPRAIRIHETGGPEVMRLEDADIASPAEGEVQVRHTAIGVNFIDVYFRRGLYKAPAMPFTPGQEGAGLVEAVGPGVTEVAVGDHVAYAGLPGSYAEVRVAPAARLVKLPPGIDDRTAAAMMLKGMTAEVLLLRCARVSRGDTILFHAAAGGVGTITVQWAKHLGLRVINSAGKDPGQIQNDRWFPRADVGGMDFGINAGYNVSERITITVGMDFRNFFYTMNSRLEDFAVPTGTMSTEARRPVAGGANDMYFAGIIAARYSLR